MAEDVQTMLLLIRRALASVFMFVALLFDICATFAEVVAKLIDSTLDE